jgi:hypothetical protein
VPLPVACFGCPPCLPLVAPPFSGGAPQASPKLTNNRCPWPHLPRLPCSEKRGLDDELHGRERVLEGLGRDLSRGLNNVKRLTHELKLDGQVGAGAGGGMSGWRWGIWSRPAVPTQVSLSCRRQQSRSHVCGLPPVCPQCRPTTHLSGGFPCLAVVPLASLQVHGTMIELFDCRKELYTATEVVANNSLFHVVVSQRSSLRLRSWHSMHSAACAGAGCQHSRAWCTQACNACQPLRALLAPFHAHSAQLIAPHAHTAYPAHPTLSPAHHALSLSPRALLQVENDDVALRLTAELNRGKCGRVSFMPLNRMNPPEVKYPDQVRAGHAALSCAVPACCALLCAGCAGLLPLLRLSLGRAAVPWPAALLQLAPARMPTWPARPAFPCCPHAQPAPRCPASCCFSCCLACPAVRQRCGAPAQEAQV